jgi:hypothetical protein
LTASREGSWPSDLLRGYRPVHIVADVYGGQVHLLTGGGGIATEIICWANARRPFHQRLDDAPGARSYLELIQALYHIDHIDHIDRIDRVVAIVAQSLHRDPVTERTRLGQQEAPFLLADIRARTDAMIATEPVESPIAVGRKNGLTVAGENGGTWAATVLAIYQSCRLQGAYSPPGAAVALPIDEIDEPSDAIYPVP